MKFLLDANIPYSAKDVFSSSSAVSHISDIGLASATDEMILKRARRERAVLITRDLEFGNALLFSPARHWGVVVLRLPSSYSAPAIKRVLGDFMAKADVRLFPKSIFIVEEGRFRVRR